METATISVLYSEADWPFLGDALASAAGGDGQALLEMADFWMGRAEDGSYATLVDAYSIIECASGTYAYEPENPEALLEQLKDEAPWYSRDYEVEDLGASCDDVFGDPDIFEIDVTASIPIVVSRGHERSGHTHALVRRNGSSPRRQGPLGRVQRRGTLAHSRITLRRRFGLIVVQVRETARRNLD